MELIVRERRQQEAKESCEQGMWMVRTELHCVLQAGNS